MKALVTGGAGFIGGHLVRRLLELGHEVRVLDNFSSGHLRNIPAGVQIMEGDVRDAACVEEALTGVDACFHLAAIASVSQCNNEWVSSHSVNITGWLTVLTASARQTTPPTLVYASSAAVYGACSTLPLVETRTAAPLSPYAADKLGCELHAAAAEEVLGLQSVGLRFFNVYGPGQDPRSPYSGVISRFAERLTAGQSLNINGSGEQTRDFVFVSDVADALVACAQSKLPSSRVFNVCSGVETSILSLGQTMAMIYGRPFDATYSPRQAGDVLRSLGDPTRLQVDVGFRPSISLAEGLQSLKASSALR